MKKLIAITMAVFLIGCAGQQYNKQQKGTAIGAGAGAAAGAAVGAGLGSHNRGTKMIVGGLIGAIAGGLLGNQVGAYMDRQETALRNAMSAATAADQASIQRSQDVLIATFKSDVFFDFNSYALKPGAYPELDRVANVLNQYPQTTIQIQGHTDATGSESYNQQLSEKRAEAVKNALVQRGVDPARMTAIGFGKSQLISSNAAQNRRVTIVITPIRAS
jgi:outer membrane protein OmpA-like peptidoglycan-associated protein